MITLNPSTRLKVKKDTFFIPDPNGGVYFRNNTSSFRMRGNTIYQWIEKLMPMFNGEHTLGELTEGLPAPYQKRVYEIGEILYKNGFVRDMSRDQPHQLDSKILKKYASQIEFIESFVDSGAYRFQIYRQTKVLVVGSGSLFVALVSALIESGLPKFHIFVTESKPTNRKRLNELVEHARKTDFEVAIEEITPQVGKEESFWEEVVKSFEWILYVSEEGNIAEFRAFNAICKKKKKGFMPVFFSEQIGIAGPVVHPEQEGCWESAWRRIHLTQFQRDRTQPISTTAGAMLANVIVFELFKKVTGVAKPKRHNQFFLLHPDTLEGDWHSFIKHPLVTTNRIKVEFVQDLDLRMKQQSKNKSSSRLFQYFNQLTSKSSGIFHVWEEKDLKQLPLAQCCVQTVDPCSEGPAELLPEIVCAGLTHEEARREAGLTGIEAYVSQMKDILVTADLNNEKFSQQEFIGFGAGETIEEGVSRGLQKCLDEELRKRLMNKREHVFRIQLDTIDDEHCQYYLQALSTINGLPKIYFGMEVLGFPVVWVESNGRSYARTGLNSTLALRKALEQALINEQNRASTLYKNEFEDIGFQVNEKKIFRIGIHRYENWAQFEVLKSAMSVLKQNYHKLLVFDFAIEPFLQEELAGVFGVVLRKEND